MKIGESRRFMCLDISKVNNVYYSYICDRTVFFHPDLVVEQEEIDFPIRGCDIFTIDLKNILVIPGNKILYHLDTKGGYIDDVSGTYFSYFLSRNYDQALVLSPSWVIVNVS